MSNITIKTNKHGTFSVDFDEKTTILDVKNKIKQKFEFDEKKKIDIIFCGRTMNDDIVLNDASLLSATCMFAKII